MPADVIQRALRVETINAKPRQPCSDGPAQVLPAPRRDARLRGNPCLEFRETREGAAVGAEKPSCARPFLILMPVSCHKPAL
jgi:hypothetical protein